MTNTPHTQEQVSVRMPRGLIEQVRELAVANDRTLAAELRVALRYYIEGARFTNPVRGKS
jgi:Arc-like DNA binding domain